MHEFSLAQSVQETVISIAKQRSAKEIKKVILKFGAFALIICISAIVLGYLSYIAA